MTMLAFNVAERAFHLVTDSLVFDPDGSARCFSTKATIHPHLHGLTFNCGSSRLIDRFDSWLRRAPLPSGVDDLATQGARFFSAWREGEDDDAKADEESVFAAGELIFFAGWSRRRRRVVVLEWGDNMDALMRRTYGNAVPGYLLGVDWTGRELEPHTAYHPPSGEVPPPVVRCPDFLIRVARGLHQVYAVAGPRVGMGGQLHHYQLDAKGIACHWLEDLPGTEQLCADFAAIDPTTMEPWGADDAA